MNARSLWLRLTTLFAALALLALPADLNAQTGGSSGSGGSSNTGGIQIGGAPTTTTGTTTTGGTSTSTGTVSGLNELLDLTANELNIGNFSDESMFENDRIQPFVGPSSENVVHPRSQTASGSTGGSTRSSAGAGRATGRSTGAASGNATSFSVPRRSIRTGVRYAFREGHFDSRGVAANFADRIQRTPVLNDLPGVEVSVESRVATLTGTVANAQQRELIERQLRLEPGISSVINLLQISQ